MKPSRYLALLCGFALVLPAAAQEPAAVDPGAGYIGADACKDCHPDTYEAWKETKHARALDKLSAQDRADATCVGCHATGTPEMIAADGTNPRHPHVQCESCHGPGAAHVAAAGAGPTDASRARKGITKSQPQSNCQRCHSSQSPHFKGFFYQQMRTLVH